MDAGIEVEIDLSTTFDGQTMEAWRGASARTAVASEIIDLTVLEADGEGAAGGSMLTENGAPRGTLTMAKQGLAGGAAAGRAATERAGEANRGSREAQAAARQRMS